MVQIAGVGLLLMWRFNVMLSFHYRKFYCCCYCWPFTFQLFSVALEHWQLQCNRCVLVLRFHAFIVLANRFNIQPYTYMHACVCAHIIISLIIIIYFFIFIVEKFDPAVVILFVLFIHMSSYARLQPFAI